MDEVLTSLSASNHDTAIDLAALPQQVRGFGPVKMDNLAKVREQEAALLAAFRNPAPVPQAAA